MTKRLLGTLLALCCVLPACGGSDASEGSVKDSFTATGVIVKIDSEGIGKVRGFTLKTSEGTLEVSIDPDVAYEFPLDHLHEHLAASEPVECKLERRDGKLYAVTIEDA